MIPLHLIGGVGAVKVLGKLVKFKGIGKIGTALLIGLFILSIGRFVHGYTEVVPYETRYLQAWHYYGILFEKLRSYCGERIFFLGGQYYINLAFFLGYDPVMFQKEVRIRQPENLVEFDHVESFGPYEFRKTRDVPSKLEPDTLHVRLNEEGESWPDGKREYVLFTHAPESHVLEDVDEWVESEGFRCGVSPRAARRGATGFSRWGSTSSNDSNH